MALPQDVTGLSAVCDCGISCSYLLFLVLCDEGAVLVAVYIYGPLGTYLKEMSIFSILVEFLQFFTR